MSDGYERKWRCIFYDNRCSICQNARVAELADAQDLKSCCSDTVPVRFRSRAAEEINSILVNIQGLSFFITWEISHTIKSTSCDNAQLAYNKNIREEIRYENKEEKRKCA